LVYTILFAFKVQHPIGISFKSPGLALAFKVQHLTGTCI